MNISLLSYVIFVIAMISLVIFEISLGEMIRIRRVSSRFGNVKKEDMETFRKIDTNHDGALSKSELEAALVVRGVSRVDFNSLFSLTDLNSDGQINFFEFVSPSLVNFRKKQNWKLEILELPTLDLRP